MKNLMKVDINKILRPIFKLDEQQKLLENKADLILSTSGVGQAPPVYHETLNKAIIVRQKKAKIWNEIRGIIYPGTDKTLWQIAVDSKLQVVQNGKESQLNFFAEDFKKVLTELNK